MLVSTDKLKLFECRKGRGRSLIPWKIKERHGLALDFFDLHFNRRPPRPPFTLSSRLPFCEPTITLVIHERVAISLPFSRRLSSLAIRPGLDDLRSILARSRATPLPDRPPFPTGRQSSIQDQGFYYFTDLFVLQDRLKHQRSLSILYDKNAASVFNIFANRPFEFTTLFDRFSRRLIAVTKNRPSLEVKLFREVIDSLTVLRL